MSVRAKRPPIRPPFKRSRFDFRSRSKSKVDVAFKDAILTRVKGQRGFRKNIDKIFCSKILPF